MAEFKKPEPGEEIVITGISGVYPNCENISELAYKLFAREDLIQDVPDINFSVGKLKFVNKFDASFFGITNEHAEYMDPMCRILLEKTYEAILDAGYNVGEFKNKNTAVFIANCTSDAEVESTFRTDIKGALICERAQSFLANRISYWLGTHGPSCTVNTACSSSLYALNFAYQAIRDGECENAVVGGSNLCLSPGMVELYKNLGITSPRCRSFDDHAIGFCRSEAISVILLQKAKHARRIYAEVVNIKTNNDGYKKQSILFPSDRLQADLINRVHEECGVKKSEICWVEAHGTGTRVGDYQEMKSLETLCDSRDKPLLVGCVKSNLGHTEATSGLCSIAKVIIAGESGFIPPNLHYTKPQNGIQALRNGKLKIITEITSWDGGYVAVNNFGIGGSNAHLLLKTSVKQPILPPFDDVARLVTISGRSMESVHHIITYLEDNPINVEFIGLLHQIFRTTIPNHDFRGYVIVEKTESSMTKHIEKVKKQNRPVWFVYPGMGSQWTTMAKELLKLKIFENSIRECHAILEKRGLNLLKILTAEDEDFTKNILNCFVGITAIMIALTDVLASLGITPEGFIGHSFGEIGCAYADRCLDKKEALMTAYYRGVVSLETYTINGLMAVIGLRGKEMEKRCPAPVEVVCYNGANSCTIAGPVEMVRKIINELRIENIYANEIYSANIAYHSSYIRNMGAIYEKYLQKTIRNSKTRSPKWISSSFEEREWSADAAKYCSSYYFVHNLINKVKFEDCLKHVPNDAIVIEVAPHSIFKSVLNYSLNQTISIVSLTNKHHSRPLEFFLASLGTLYNYGLTMDTSCLYSPIQFPVGRATPMISPLIKWNHEKDWYVPFEKWNQTSTRSSDSRLVVVDYENEEWQYLRQCVVGKRNVFPESGYLKMVWEIFAEKNELHYRNMSVTFKNVYFHKSIEIPQNEPLEFCVVIMRKNGIFEITFRDEVIAEGYISILDRREDKKTFANMATVDDNAATVDRANIYKELRIKGYDYGEHFQTILTSNAEGTKGKIMWKNDWIKFLDAINQFFFLHMPNCGHPKFISRIDLLEINVKKHNNIVNESKSEINIQLSPNYVLSGGVKMNGIGTKGVSRKRLHEPTLQTFEFVPYFSKKCWSKEEMIQIMATIVTQNNVTFKLNFLEVMTTDSSILSVDVDKYYQSLPFYKTDVYLSGENVTFNSSTIPSYFKTQIQPLEDYRNIHLMILPPSATSSTLPKNLSEILAESGFILTRKNSENIFSRENKHTILKCAEFLLENENFELWHKVTKDNRLCRSVRVNHGTYDWIKKLQFLVDENNSKIILFAEGYDNGLIGFYNCIRKEPCGHHLRCFLILDEKAPQFQNANELYHDQMKFDLAVNVYKNGKWGCYVPFNLAPFLPLILTPYIDLVRDENGGFFWMQKKSNQNTDGRIHVHYATIPPHYGTTTPTTINEDRVVDVYEFSGKDHQHRNIMGICWSGVISNVAERSRCLYWDVPNDLTLESAATVPMTYIMALLYFKTKSRNQKNILLIQNAYSHYGQAVLFVALYYGYKIITVEKTQNECNHLKKNFPQIIQSFSIDEANVLDGITKTTRANRVDILVLAKVCSCTVELLSLVASYGEVVYFGYENESLSNIIKIVLREGLQFKRISVREAIVNEENTHAIRTQFQELINKGYFKPFTQRICKAETIDNIELFIDINTKTLLHLPASTLILKQSNPLLEAMPKFTCGANDVIIICGGLGGMGLELTDWLVTRGATKLILVSRTGHCDGYKLKKIATLSRIGASIIITTDDLTSVEGVKNLLQTANKLGPVFAIFNLCLILKDDSFKNQTEETFKMVINPKAVATSLLDELSRKMCPNLKHFVVFSSITCGYGNAGQSNYGYANSAMERVCEKRKLAGLPALAIEWAGVGEVGYLEKARIVKLPDCMRLQSISSCLHVLERFLLQSDTIVTSFIVEKETTSKPLFSDSIFKTIQKITEKSEIIFSNSSTLRDIGIDSITAAETKNILERECDVYLSGKEIFDLRLKDLWEYEKKRKIITGELENECIRKQSILEEVYSNLFGIMKKEEHITRLQPLIRLPSYLHHGATTEIPVSMERTIFFLPSIEGFAKVMRPLASHIDFQVLCAQYDIRMTSINQITKSLLSKIEERLVDSEPFHLLGYSYGGLIAMEIAHVLEKKGKCGYLYIVDGSPSIVKWISKKLYKDRDFYTNTISFVRALNPPINIKEFEDGLQGQENWENARRYIDKSLPENLRIKKEYLIQILDTFYERNKQIESYDGIPKQSLKSQIFVFKPEDTLFQIPAQHGLTEYCISQAHEFSIPGNHFTILKSEKLAYYLMNLYKT